MKNFQSYEEIRDLYDKGNYDIFYENKSKGVKYQVSHIGSTIYCRNTEKGMGMGAVNNFALEDFYAVEKPKVVNETSINEQ